MMELPPFTQTAPKVSVQETPAMESPSFRSVAPCTACCDRKIRISHRSFANLTWAVKYLDELTGF